MESDDAIEKRGGEAFPSRLVQVNSAMVRIYKRHFGRGPVRVHSHYAGPDAIVCFLEGTLTPVERTLTALDEHQRLRDIRQLFQSRAEHEYRSAIESITGRLVVAFLSAIDTMADVASEIFVLETATQPPEVAALHSPRAEGTPGGTTRSDPLTP
jgi:uncharacterized protein YbcI